MSEGPIAATMFLILNALIQIGLIVRVLLRPHREPASRIAWIVVIVTVPVLGIVAYLLLGETNIGRRRGGTLLFVGDWMAETGEAIGDLLTHPLPPSQTGLPAQVVGTGPTIRHSAMPEMFELLMYTARCELVRYWALF